MTTSAEGHGTPARSSAAEAIVARAMLVAEQALGRARVAAGASEAHPDDARMAKQARRSAAKATAVAHETEWVVLHAEELATNRAATLVGVRAARRVRKQKAKRKAADWAGPNRLAVAEPHTLKPTTTSLEDADRGLFGRGVPRPIARRS